MNVNKDHTTGGRTFKGVVISDKMKDTVVVEVSRYSRVPKYEKFVMSRKRYKAHDPGNTKTIGDTVTIRECRPISKEKRFRVMQNGNIKKQNDK